MAFNQRNRFNVSSFTDLPPDSYSSCAALEVFKNEIYVSGCDVLTEYSDNRISFISSLGLISVEGELLHVASLEGGKMIISGKIRSVNFGTNQ